MLKASSKYVLLLASALAFGCAISDDTDTPTGPSDNVSRFNGNYGGTISLTCPSIPTAITGTLSLSISSGTISVSLPRSGGGEVDAAGNASMRVDNPSDITGSSVLSGGFLISSSGKATGGGTFVERHTTETCSGTWAVERH